MLRRVTRTTQGVFPLDTESTVVVYKDDELVGEWTAPHTKDILAALPSLGGDEFYLTGEWEVDDDGTIYDFDYYEVKAGTTWKTFEADHWEAMQELAVEVFKWQKLLKTNGHWEVYE